MKLWEKTGRHATEGELGSFISQCREWTRSICPDFSISREALFMWSLQKISFNYLVGNHQQFDKKFNRNHGRWVHRDECAVIASVTTAPRTIFNMTHSFSSNKKLIKKPPSQMQPAQTNLEPKNGENTSKPYTGDGAMVGFFLIHVCCWKFG